MWVGADVSVLCFKCFLKGVSSRALCASGSAFHIFGPLCSKVRF